MSELQQNYDGQRWARAKIEREIEHRFPGEYNIIAMADDELRTLLIADDQGRRPLLDDTLGMRLNKLGRKVIDLITELEKHIAPCYKRKVKRKKEQTDGR